MNHRRWSRLLFACLCAGAFGVAAPSAEADDPGAALKAQARALFEDAKKLAAQSKYAEACPKFEESQRLDAGLGTKFYLADCYEHIDQTHYPNAKTAVSVTVSYHILQTSR